MKRAIIVVIDSMGIGALDDAPLYNDSLTCNTIVNTANAAGGLNLPNMQKLGLGNLADIKGVQPVENPIGQYGIMKMKSKGKDTTTGHWEIAGLILEEPFKTYKEFPPELIDEFVKETECGGILGNCAASGTAIIEELNEEHNRTKFPIVYTSADSVFQIACNIDLIPLETLYGWCEKARKILDNGWGISRVIARPYCVIDGKPSRLSGSRRDYSTPPPSKTLLNKILDCGKNVYSIGKIEDIFVKSGITKSVHTSSNAEGLKLTTEAVKNKPYDLIFTNLVDTDMLFGHRRNPKGYANALEEIDRELAKIMWLMGKEDVLIITADHGCDPTAEGTDHTRERVPVLIYGKELKPLNLGVLPSFNFVSNFVSKWLELC